jgi:hypothetical protein
MKHVQQNIKHKEQFYRIAFEGHLPRLLPWDIQLSWINTGDHNPPFVPHRRSHLVYQSVLLHHVKVFIAVSVKDIEW